MIVDVNVSLGRWPFQRFDVETPRQLVAHLRKHGIGQAWVAAVESALYPEPDEYDGRLFRRLRGVDGLHFVKTVNPTLANWRASLAEWADGKGVRAVKVYPNYHQFALGDACVRELAGELLRRRMALLVAMRLDDERGQYPLMKVPGVPCGDIAAFARATPRLPVVALSAYLGEIRGLADGADNVVVDTSFLETTDTLKAAIKRVPARRILFGSHTPFLYTRAGVMKLTLATVPRREMALIEGGNARRILGV